MARVSISVPDHVVARAKAADLNISRLATSALVDELDRRDKVAALDDYLAELERELGPIPADEAAAASTWADELMTQQPSDTQDASQWRHSA